MGEFRFLKKYIIKQGERSTKRHIFYKVNETEIISAESRMGRKFPDQLREFYLEIGYGFLCSDDITRINRIMDPNDIADFYCGDEVYEYVDRDIYEEDEMVFFDLGGEGDFLTLKLGEENNGAVYCFENKIADSLKDFIIKMDAETNYYYKGKVEES